MLQRFWDTCERFSRGETGKRAGHAWRFNVYGHTAKHLGLYEDAKRGFSRALYWDQNIVPLAKENLDICNAMILSLKQSEVEAKLSETDSKILVYDSASGHSLSNDGNKEGGNKSSKQEKMGSVDIPGEVKEICHLHRTYVSLADEKQKADLMETIMSTCNVLEKEPNSQWLGIDIANFFIQAQRPNEALDTLEKYLGHMTLTSQDKCHLTRYKKQDYSIVVGQHLREAILNLDEGVQLVLPTLACAYYLKVSDFPFLLIRYTLYMSISEEL